VLFVAQEEHFLAAVQDMVYAGEIVVLILFVIMLLGVDRSDVRSERLFLQRPIALVLGVAFLAEITVAIRAAVGFSTLAPQGFDQLQTNGNAQAIAEVLFRDYFFPFEVTSILLIVAAIAAMVLAQRSVRAVTQAELVAAEAETAS
jgi:NADH-quinone oxidoreductase subunit J